MNNNFGRPGLFVGAELCDAIDRQERIALNALEIGYDYMMKAVSGDNMAINSALASKWFAIAGAVGGLINARVNAARLRTELRAGRPTQ